MLRTLHENTPLAPLSAEATLVSRFEQSARTYPQNTAVVYGERQLTFAELNQQANRVAHTLLALHLEPESMIAIWLDRSTDMIAAMLGVLKAGHAYLPLEATYPATRISQTLEDAQPAVLISEHQLASKLEGLSPRLLSVEDCATSPETDPEIDFDPSTLAYVMYTSGSTGKPKGVLVTHRNVVRLFDSTGHRFLFNPSDTWTMFHSLAFDFSVWEIWGPLLTGAKLVIVPFETTRSPEDFYKLLADEQVTVLNQTPSAFALLNQVEARGPQLPLALRLVIFGGEALTFSSLKSWFKRHGDIAPRLVNCYGITETTVHVTIREVTEHDAQTEYESLIGEPISDLQIHLLDPTGMPVVEGQVGELCVSGAGVSLGYLNRPELTLERFVPNRFSAPGAFLYRSGDLARRRADGELVYAGRRDEQVKINGFRIELGEIESVLSSFPGIAKACVLPHTDDAGQTQLAAYFVEEDGASVGLSPLAAFLMRNLPAQMLPAFYTRVPGIPLTANGKTDRKALPTPSRDNLFVESTSREPESEIEKSVLELVRDVVGVQTIGLDDNFFTVGGHSLLGTQFVMRARKVYGIKSSLRDIFEAETVAELAACIETLILQEIDGLSEEEARRLSQEFAA